MTKPTVHKIGECEIDIWHDHQILATRFADGLSVTAAANDDPDSIERAAALGYASTWEMSRAHEIAHTLLAVAQGHPYSFVLRGVAIRQAGGRKESIISKGESAAEEILVLDFQRYVQRGIVSAHLQEFATFFDLDLDDLAAELRRLTSE